MDVRQAPDRKIADLAKSHGIQTYMGDGNNVNQVSEIAKEAIKFIKENNAPAFIELETFRWLEHCGPNGDDELGYRQKGELDKWIKRDPLSTFSDLLIEKNQLSKNSILEVKEIITTEIDEAFKFAKLSPFPDLSILNQHIYKS